MRMVGVMLALTLGAAAVSEGDGSKSAPDGGRALIVDDFRRADGLSALGTPWRAFTDRVMGGVSNGRAVRETAGDQAWLRLSGDVSLENNGGFVQAALALDPRGGSLDARAFKGIRLKVRGNGERYYLHLRTADTRLPWQYYAASFEASRDWKVVELPFSSFKAEALSKPLDTSTLRSLGLVAAKKAIRCDVSVAEVAFTK